MRVMLRHAGAERAGEWLAERQLEHAGYYGTPAGASSAGVHDHLGIPVHGGFVSREIALLLLGKALEEEGASLAKRASVLRPATVAGGWCTSAGNLCVVAILEDGYVLEYRAGRRHGIKHPGWGALAAREVGTFRVWSYLESRVRDADPDAMDLRPEKS